MAPAHSKFANVDDNDRPTKKSKKVDKYQQWNIPFFPNLDGNDKEQTVTLTLYREPNRQFGEDEEDEREANEYDKKVVLFSGTTAESYCKFRLELEEYIEYGNLNTPAKKFAGAKQLLAGDNR